MPRRDSTGPMGQGPMTGRGLGNCTGANNNGEYGTRIGRGFGIGRGTGLGIGRGLGTGRGLRSAYGRRKIFGRFL